MKHISTIIDRLTRPKCAKCGRFLGNTNCDTSGRIGDATRGLCVCSQCMAEEELAALNKGKGA